MAGYAPDNNNNNNNNNNNSGIGLKHVKKFATESQFTGP